MSEKSLSDKSGSSCMKKNIYYKNTYLSYCILNATEATVVPILKREDLK